MNICKHCNDTLFTEIYDTCMTCYEKNHAQANMEKTIEDCQKEINALQATVNGDGYNIKRLSEENEKLQKELKYCKNNNDIQSDVLKRQWDILDKTLFELPVGYIPNHTYENIPEHVAYYVKESVKYEKEATDASLAAWVAEEALEALEECIKTHYEYYSGFAVNKNLSSIHMLDTLFKSKPMYNHADSKENEHLVNDNRKLHGEIAKCIKDTMSIENERDHYKAALEEIVKRPIRSESCKLIAQKALGRLNDDGYQPELLIEENLALKMKIEDLQTVINEKILDKVFHEKANPLTCCPDCGKYWDYHHEQHCEAKNKTYP